MIYNDQLHRERELYEQRRRELHDEQQRKREQLALVREAHTWEDGVNHFGQYEPPFAPARQQNAACVCIVCGYHGTASLKISEYPFRFIPPEWSVAAKSHGLRCRNCTRDRKVEPVFFNENDIWVSPPKSSMDGYGHPEQVITIVQHPRVIENHVQQPKEVSMPRNPDEVTDPVSPPSKTRGAQLKQSLRDASAAIGEGTKMAIANQVGETLVDMARDMSGGHPYMQMVLAHPDGRDIVKAVMATFVKATADQTNMPYSDFVGSACELQLKASSYEVWSRHMGSLRKHMMKLAQFGAEATGQSLQATANDSVEEFAKMQSELEEMRRELAELRRPRTPVHARAEVDDLPAGVETEDEIDHASRRARTA